MITNAPKSIETHYNGYKGFLARLSQRLTATDRLIDQIVYQLYSLTPAEIAIVEET
ncbi:MAG: hypothetical protein H6667_22285 [Ardenticatenaceae bacterium]|nr:hypothetical protein [Ardenticatenaceae bacterium]MCB9444833.1 hypothetical protein [Ardenticatenaceae bacterium]